jgi:hypothetical protein
MYPKYIYCTSNIFCKFINEARINFSFNARVLEVSTSVGGVFIDRPE